MTVASFLFGALTFRLMIRPVLGASDHTMVVICIGFFVGFEAIALAIWGADPQAVPRVFPDTVWNLGGVRITATGCVGAILKRGTSGSCSP